jgi:hypothetical protein
VYRYLSRAVFAEQAVQHFDFLRGRGYLGPETADYFVAFSSGALGVEVLYDDRDGRVVTVVRSSGPERTLRASLPVLYAAGGLGPVQHVRDIARTRKALGPVLCSNAEALVRVLPLVEGPDGRSLIERSRGR